MKASDTRPAYQSKDLERSRKITIQKIKEIAYKRIALNQQRTNCDSSKEELIYAMAYNDGVSGLVKDIEIELEKETQTEEQKS